MNSATTSLVLILISTIAFANAICHRPYITQTFVHAWEEDGQSYSLWDAHIHNNQGSDDLLRVYIDVPQSTLQQIWELKFNSGNNHYEFPEWRNANGGVPAGSFHTFGYITRSPNKLEPSVYAYSCSADGWGEGCMCTLHYAPVCGLDGNTYSNQCHLECSGVGKSKDGAC